MTRGWVLEGLAEVQKTVLFTPDREPKLVGRLRHVTGFSTGVVSSI